MNKTYKKLSRNTYDLLISDILNNTVTAVDRRKAQLNAMVCDLITEYREVDSNAKYLKQLIDDNELSFDSSCCISISDIRSNLSYMINCTVNAIQFIETHEVQEV